MQTAMQITVAPVAGRLQRSTHTRLMSPAGVAPLGGRGEKPPPAGRTEHTAFVPVRRNSHRGASRASVAVRAQLEDVVGAAVDSAPSAFHNLAAHISTSLFLLGDAASTLAAGSDAVSNTLSDAAAAVGDAAPAVAEVAKKNGGFFGAFASAFETFLKVLDQGIEKVGIPYSYGFAIITLTVLVKLATYPLTKQQVESTLSMQSMQPRVKELQAKFANDPERLQMETAKMYQTAGVNPLAGCLPSLATIPVFIGLYRALSNVADEGLLTEGFFWIPSLAGPTTVNGGLGWLTQWQDGAPVLGYGQTAAYLVLPILLIVSQYISQKVISPPQSQDPAQQQTQNILKFLPLMIGYFSLNVPSGLTLYWFVNNLLTTAQQLYLRRSFTAAQASTNTVASPGGGGGVTIDVTPEVDNRPKGKDINARRSSKPKQLEAEAPARSSGGGGSRGEKFRAIRAREAASRAASQAGAGAAGAAAAEQRGAKFKALKEKEAAAKAAAQQAGSSNGAAAPAAQAEETGRGVAVVAEVLEDGGGTQSGEFVEAEVSESESQSSQQHQQQQHKAGSSTSAAAGDGGGKGKKGKKGKK
ncbi:Inner membrane ALBINO3-like protein 2 [Chlorella vulgaris]